MSPFAFLVSSGLLIRCPHDHGVYVAYITEGGLTHDIDIPPDYQVVLPDFVGSFGLDLDGDGLPDEAGQVIGCSDVNLDGEKTDADLEAFFEAFIAADPDNVGSADWNQDGLVDEEDIAKFFAALAEC